MLTLCFIIAVCCALAWMCRTDKDTGGLRSPVHNAFSLSIARHRMLAEALDQDLPPRDDLKKLERIAVKRYVIRLLARHADVLRQRFIATRYQVHHYEYADSAVILFTDGPLDIQL